MTPQVLFVGAFVLIVVVDRVVPVPFSPAGRSAACRAPLIVLGLALWAWGVASFQRSGETPDPRQATGRVLTNGAFRVSRNPIYAGATIVFLGLAVLLDTLTGLGVAVALTLIAHFVAILPEERYLETKFGEEYRAYRASVRRWI
ncbi:MAG: DUF1295 domain-containing protein [Dehalococcoidia bacterium]|nr:DUF1295 domain-containing protein [Dehalococcoidia bacterium]